jgi:hypothetical protein
VLALVGLTEAGGREVGEFSLGMRQGYGLAVALPGERAGSARNPPAAQLSCATAPGRPRTVPPPRHDHPGLDVRHAGRVRRQIPDDLQRGASSAVLQIGALATTRGELLPVWGGALLLVAYAVVLSAVAARLTLRRDLS